MDHLRSTGGIYNDADFSKKLMKNRSHVSEVVNGKRPVTAGFVQDIVKVFPELNPEWLLNPNCTRMLMYEQGPVGYAEQHDDKPALPARVFKNLNGLALIPQEDVQRIFNKLEELNNKIEAQNAHISRLLGIIEKFQS